MEVLMKGWADALSRTRDGHVREISIVGGGAAGVELALAIEYRLRREFPLATPHVRVIADTPILVPQLNAGARRRLKLHLGRRGIGVHLAAAVAQVAADSVRLETGIEFRSDATFWAAGASAPPWIAGSGLAVDTRGFMLVNDSLQCVTDRDVFGAGDCVSHEGRALPKAGVFAVRAAPVLAANLRAAAHGGALIPHVTSPRHLALIATGRRHAVGAWDGLAFQGAWVWRWKDRIDRDFVARYSEPSALRR
jgi:selenide,water dikinase